MRMGNGAPTGRALLPALLVTAAVASDANVAQHIAMVKSRGGKGNDFIGVFGRSLANVFPFPRLDAPAESMFAILNTTSMHPESFRRLTLPPSRLEMEAFSCPARHG